MIETKTWIAGQLKPCTPQEFTQGLRRYAGWADMEFGTRSDPAAHLSERLNAAADFIDALVSSVAGEGDA
jgi:hypothetical protein